MPLNERQDHQNSSTSGIPGAGLFGSTPVAGSGGPVFGTSKAAGFGSRSQSPQPPTNANGSEGLFGNANAAGFGSRNQSPQPPPTNANGSGGGFFGTSKAAGLGPRSQSPQPPISVDGLFGGSKNFSFGSAGTSGEQAPRGLFSNVRLENTTDPGSTTAEAPTFQVFKNPKAEKLLGLIDHLRQAGLDRDVALPELVVTGNQSSGKSSLLESLTGLPFPSNVRTCTRFITKVSIRRSPEIKFKASIISDTNKKFNKTYLKDPSRDEFKDLVNNISKELGVQESGFSADILHIEISGPDRNPLSFMDTPGLFHSGSLAQKQEDADVVKRLVRNQIESPRVIIIAVMAASDNTETQSVWSLADAVDPESVRTVGVLTKCDRLDKLEQELVLEVARNKKKILRQGWWVVKNRSGSEVIDGKPLEQSRKEEEAFFNDEKWSGLPRNHVGVNALKTCLEKLLCDHIKKELPKMQNDVCDRLGDAKKSLRLLGPSRPTIASQREYLIKIADSHIKYMKRQLEHVHKWADSYKLWNEIQKLREDFQEKMKDVASIDLDESSAPLPKNTELLLIQADLKKGVNEEFIGAEPFKWLIHRYEAFRGRELPGRIDSHLVSALFAELTEEWEYTVEEHLEEVQTELKSCFYSCLESAARDDRTYVLLKEHLSLEQEEIIAKLKHEVSQHVQRDRSNVSTTNPEYERRIHEAREDRMASYLSGALREFGDMKSKPALRSITAEPRWTIIELHDMIKTYYDLAAQNVVDSISKQVIDPFILNEGSPLKFFDRAYIEKLSAEDVEKIAGEPPEVICERVDLEKKIKRLSEALEMSSEVCKLTLDMKKSLLPLESDMNDQ